MKAEIIQTILKEYGVKWAISRSLYSVKGKMMSVLPVSERLFEKRVGYPERLNLFRFDVNKIKDFVRNLPEREKAELVGGADKICEGKIFGFSSIYLDYGCPIDWQLNPMTGKKCNVEDKWYQIPDFDEQRGDIKVIWEASRFSHFITLARAYLLTGDGKYYRAFSAQLDGWIKTNPYSFGANFKCGQECALRMANGLLAYAVFETTGISTESDKRNIETLILRCYRKILSNFFYAYRCIKNNHTISELMGMIIGAWCCGDVKRLSYAFQTLDEVINEQFTADGGYCQFSFNYERLALQILEVVLSIERQTGYRLSENSRRKILAAANLMYQCQDDSGDMPNYGSNDGALAFPVTACGYRDFRPTVNAIHAILDGKSPYGHGAYEEELLWFGKDIFFEIEDKGRAGTAFDRAGLYTLRKADSWAMIVLNDYKLRPADMDQMHLELWTRGINVFCDGGSYSYASEVGKRLVRNESHNTVVYDGKEQMGTHGAFLVYNWTRRGRVKHTNLIFDGEMESKNGYVHHRSVEVTDKGYRVKDCVKGKNGFKILFHTPCEVLDEDGVLVLRFDGRVICRIRSSAKPVINRAYRSLYYLRKEASTCIEFSANAADMVVTEIEVVKREEK